MNKAILIGNVTKDLELKSTQSGVSTVSFTVAVQRRFANAQGVKESDFIPVVVWRQLAELCAKFLHKGSKVCVTGAIQTRSYDAQDGSKRFVTEVVADEVEFLYSKSDAANDNARQAEPAEPSNMTEADDDGDLPF